jgi:hypothetical protein
MSLQWVGALPPRAWWCTSTPDGRTTPHRDRLHTIVGYAPAPAATSLSGPTDPGTFPR